MGEDFAVVESGMTPEVKGLIDRLIAVAESQVGYTEDPPGSNRTKYGECYGWNGVAWCVMFVWWCFREAGLSELFYSGERCASCSQYVSRGKRRSRWITGGYQPGDIVFLDVRGDGVPRHVGIAKEVKHKTVVTIEGNTSNESQDNGGCVMVKKREKRMIVGAVRPDYGSIREERDMTGQEIYEKLNEYLRTLPVPDWAEEELGEAVELDVTDGTRPQCLVPRYQAAIMAVRAAKALGGRKGE